MDLAGGRQCLLHQIFWPSEGKGSGWIALPLLPCENSWSGKQVSWTSLIQRQHNIADNFDAHAGRESPTSLLGSQNTSHTQDLACSGLSLNG